jgi:hypothetical protein
MTDRSSLTETFTALAARPLRGHGELQQTASLTEYAGIGGAMLMLPLAALKNVGEAVAQKAGKSPEELKGKPPQQTGKTPKTPG